MEPKVEDLLASIRKAIDSDLGGTAPTMQGETRGTLMRGALREMRVSLDNHERKGTSPEQEIAELRGRILRSASEAPALPAPPRRLVRPLVEPPRQLATAKRDDFRRIMETPQTSRGREVPPALPPSARLPDPPNFRASLADDDEFDDVNYQQQRPQYAPQQAVAFHDPYADTPYGYEEELPPQPQARAYAPPHAAPLLSQQSEAAAAQAFRQLSETLLSRAAGGRPLEELTTDLLRGMLKQWLDENLPGLVERLVREEIQRVARRGR